MKRTFLVLFALMNPALVFSQSNVGTAGLQFLEIATSARVAGMGEAFVAIADDASALYYNPAGIGRLSKRQLLVNHSQYPAEISLEYVGFVYPVSTLFGVIGGSFTGLNYGDFIETDPLGGGGTGVETGRTFTPYENSAQITYAKMLTERFSTGISLKFIRSSLFPGYDATTMAGDVGTLYDTHYHTVKIGMCITNFGPDHNYNFESAPLPLNFKVGLSASPIQNEKSRVILNFEGSHPNHNEEQAILGGEFSYKDFFFLRSGYKINYDAETWSGGAGFKISTNKLDLRVDAAYTDTNFLNSFQRFSLLFAF